MKRHNNLKQSWCNYESLLEAFYEVKKNKCYHKNILEYENNLCPNLEKLLSDLEKENYKVRPSRAFFVHDPKTRLIEAPHLEDRIVQHALMNTIRDLVENRFIDTTFACRKYKGTHKANNKLKSYLINYKNEGYYLKVDIEKFFYSINHEQLIKQLNKIIKCKPTLELLTKFFKNGTGKGLPLGSVTSQVLANLALSPIDHLVKRKLKIRHYVRYMDDFVLLSESRQQLVYCLRKIKELAAELELRCNKKTVIGKIKNGIDFVGYKTWFNRRVIRKRSLYKIRRSMKKSISINQIASFLAHSKQTNSLPYVAKLIIAANSEFEVFIKNWILKNKYGVYNEIFSS